MDPQNISGAGRNTNPPRPIRSAIFGLPARQELSRDDLLPVSGDIDDASGQLNSFRVVEPFTTADGPRHFACAMAFDDLRF